VTDEEERVVTPLLVPSQGLPDVVNTEAAFEQDFQDFLAV
jgi:hypothetical protein